MTQPNVYRNFFNFDGQPSEKGDRFKKKRYNYSYDALNRITAAIRPGNGNYNVAGISYDKNGNLLTLQRIGHTNAAATTFGLMDNLKYEYHLGGNFLAKVTDLSRKSTGFKDGNISGSDYGRDANGNMKIDKNKKITNITYNHLNLPTQVTINGKNIDYKYDATGMKLSKTVEGVTTQYAGGYIYENDVLQFFNHPEGYVKPDNTGGFDYVYQYKDIWRNTRVTYSDLNNDGVITPTTEILREQNYYPFGLEHRGYNSNIIGAKNNLKQYQAQEFTEDLGLNTHEWRYRVSDPATGRFWQIDPLSEKYLYNSTYAFQENKLGSGIELEGLENVDWEQQEQQQYYEVSKEAQGILARMGSYLDKFFASFSTTNTQKINSTKSTGSNGEVSKGSTINHTTTTTVTPNLEEFISNISTAKDGTAIMPENTPMFNVKETETITASSNNKMKVNIKVVNVSLDHTSSTNTSTGEESVKNKLGVGIDQNGNKIGAFISVKTSSTGTKIKVGLGASTKLGSTTSGIKIGISHKIEDE